jgi:hypothetical protein
MTTVDLSNLDVHKEQILKSAFVDQAQGRNGLIKSRQRVNLGNGEYIVKGGYAYQTPPAEKPKPTAPVQDNIGTGLGAPIKIIYVKDILD